MNYLYHAVPQNMEGSLLYPFNELQKIKKTIAEKANEKYIGRESSQQETIDRLNCTWGDVINFIAVDPRELSQARKALGRPLSGRFYQIDPHQLEPAKTAVYLFQSQTVDEKNQADEFVAYDPDKLDPYVAIPLRTIEYYKECLALDRPMMAFAHVPHILYRGTVDISQAEIIEI